MDGGASRGGGKLRVRTESVKIRRARLIRRHNGGDTNRTCQPTFSIVGITSFFILDRVHCLLVREGKVGVERYLKDGMMQKLSI